MKTNTKAARMRPGAKPLRAKPAPRKTAPRKPAGRRAPQPATPVSSPPRADGEQSAPAPSALVEKIATVAMENVMAGSIAADGMRFEPAAIAGVRVRNTRTGTMGELLGWWVNTTTGRKLFTNVRTETSFPAADVEELL